MAGCLVVKKVKKPVVLKARAYDEQRTNSQDKATASNLSLSQEKNVLEQNIQKKGGSVFKKTVVVFIILLFLLSGGYWIWNEYNLSKLTRELNQSEFKLSASSDSSDLLTAIESLSLIHQKAVQAEMPFFKKKYAEIQMKTINLLIETPLKTSDWIKANRSNAWSALGTENNIKEKIDDKDLLSTLNSLRNICETGILAEKSIMGISQKLSVQLEILKGRSDLEREINLTAEQGERIAHVGAEIARYKGQARVEIQKGLRQIDEANKEIQKYAEISVLQTACNNWERALLTIQNASAILNNIPSFEVDYQNNIAQALIKSDQEKIKEIINKIALHVEHAREELAKAEQQESTVAGKAQRTIGRWFERAKNSRIGQEIAVGVKGLVFGTKIFYDMMNIDLNTDLSSWAQSYESDMNKLMQDIDRIQHMNGWSITGKNTIIEDTVNKAYEKSFNQPATTKENKNTDIYQNEKIYEQTPKSHGNNEAKNISVKENDSKMSRVIIDEDFENNSLFNYDKWILWKESHSSTRPFIEKAKGNPGGALNGGDTCGHLCGNYLYYNKDIPYQQGLVIEFDFWCTAAGWHYTDARIGLASNREGEPKPIVLLSANKGDNTHQMITGVNKRLKERVARYQPNTWHTGKIRIRSDQYVEFYLDGRLIDRSSEKLEDIGKPATLYILGRSGNGPAYIDNVKVWIP